MIFQINLADGKPVYQQFIDQIKMAIAAGRLQAGDRLPTVRDVAVQVRVNRNTVARVYAQLENEGLLYTRSGQGTFVSEGGSRLNSQEQTRQLEGSVDELLTRAKLFGLTREDLLGLITDRMQDIFPPHNPTRKPGGRK